MTLYKKLILTFTLAAGLGALPNAFAAPPPAPGKQRTTTPAPSPTPTRVQNHGLDSIDVLAATATPKQVTPPGGVRSQTAAPGGPKHSEDNATVLAAFKPPVTTPTPTPKPIISRPQNHGLDNETVFVAFKNAGTTAGPGPKPNTTKTGGQNQEQDSTIV